MDRVTVVTWIFQTIKKDDFLVEWNFTRCQILIYAPMIQVSRKGEDTKILKLRRFNETKRNLQRFVERLKKVSVRVFRFRDSLSRNNFYEELLCKENYQN